MEVQRKGLLNTVAAGSANLLEDATARQNVICNDNTADPVVDIMDVFPYGEKVRVTSYAAADEVVQQVFIGVDTSSPYTQETVVAGRYYKMEIDNMLEKREGTKKSSRKYGYTAPVYLTGSADTDRLNLYTDLVNKVNADTANNVVAYLCQRVPFTTGAVAEPAVGETMTEAVTGTTATVAKVVISSGTFAGGDAAGFFYVYSATATFDATNDYSFTGGGTAVQNGVGVLGQGMLIADDAGYWVPSAAFSSATINVLSRAGASEITLVKYYNDGSSGFVYADAEVVQAAVYSQGKGADMLRWTPYYYYTGLDAIAGDTGYTFNDAPVSGTFYTKVVIELEKKSNTGTLANQIGHTPMSYELYLAQTSATVQGANVTNLVASIAAMS